MRLREEALTKATADQRTLFQSINGHYCYQHYACEWGCDLVGSEVGENINSIQMHIAFTRGAARQYGKPWLMDFSSWYGPSMFDEDPRRTWGDNSGPTHGHSLSLHIRTYYVSYMAGTNIVVAEGGWLNCFKSQQPGPDGTLPLSSLGEKAAEFYRFTRRHPGRGIPYTPVALVLPFDHGIYPGFAPKLSWNVFPYTPGDQQILDALNVLFPGSLGDPDQPERADQQPGNPSWKDPDYMRTETLRLVASPYGDIADVLLATRRRTYSAVIRFLFWRGILPLTAVWHNGSATTSQTVVRLLSTKPTKRAEFLRKNSLRFSLLLGAPPLLMFNMERAMWLYFLLPAFASRLRNVRWRRPWQD